MKNNVCKWTCPQFAKKSTFTLRFYVQKVVEIDQTKPNEHSQVNLRPSTLKRKNMTTFVGHSSATFERKELKKLTYSLIWTKLNTTIKVQFKKSLQKKIGNESS